MNETEPPPSQPVIINIGGEGEVSGVLNVNGTWLSRPDWFSSEAGKTLTELKAEGHRFQLVDDVSVLPFADDSVDAVYTNNVCIDQNSIQGPCPQSSEIWRVLKRNGTWIHDGEVRER